jgi:integrase
VRLTRPALANLALPPGRSELIVFDDTLPGFGVRIRAGGKRVWIAQYRMGQKQRRVTIGSLETLDPDQARKEAKSILAKVHLGSDPQAAKTQAKDRAHLTLGAMIEPYFEFASRRLKPRTFVETSRYLRTSWKPLHSLAIEKITRRTIALQLSELATANGPIAANRARIALSSFFTWAMREGLADTNPVVGTNRPSEERSRDRVLSDDELARIWTACLDDDYGRIVRILILTGQRREEAGGMAWGELDLQQACWSIPRDRTKNSLPHDVPLSETAIDVLQSCLRREGRQLVFGEAGGPFQGWSKAKAALDRRILESGLRIRPWRLHDIRRTVATRIAELGTLPHVVEAVLNHISGHKAGVAGVYNRASYTMEKRQALDKWAAYIGNIVAKFDRAMSKPVIPSA